MEHKFSSNTYKIVNEPECWYHVVPMRTDLFSNEHTLRSEGKSFKITYWPKGFFVQPAKTGTATLEQLEAMFFFPLNETEI